MQNNFASMMSRSYLGMMGAKVGEEDIAIYRIEKNQLVQRHGANGSKYFSIVVLEITGQEVSSAPKRVHELIAKLKPGGKLHVVVTSAGSKQLDLRIVLRCFLLKRELMKLNAGNIEAYGVFPDPFSPTLVMPLKRNICQFVYGELFGHNDSQLKHYIKQILVSLLGPWIWRGDIILIVNNG